MYVFKCDKASSVKHSAAAVPIDHIRLAKHEILEQCVKFGRFTLAAGRHDETVAEKEVLGGREAGWLESVSSKHRRPRNRDRKRLEQQVVK